jgi:hypothetical protein
MIVMNMKLSRSLGEIYNDKPQKRLKVKTGALKMIGRKRSVSRRIRRERYRT